MAQAENLSVDLDKAKTRISFVLTDVLHTGRGTFQLDSGSAARDRRMTENILEAQRYPEVRFTTAQLTGSFVSVGTSSVQVTGSFIIRGQAHKVVIPMQVQLSQGQVRASSKFAVP